MLTQTKTLQRRGEWERLRQQRCERLARGGRVLVVSQEGLAPEQAEQFECHGVLPLHSSSAREASELVRDAAYLGLLLVGALVDCELPDSSGYRVVQDFRVEFPRRPIAMCGTERDLCLNVWARARSIPVLRRPLAAPALETWLSQFDAGLSNALHTPFAPRRPLGEQPGSVLTGV